MRLQTFVTLKQRTIDQLTLTVCDQNFGYKKLKVNESLYTFIWGTIQVVVISLLE
jgi:hypothetical protein